MGQLQFHFSSTLKLATDFPQDFQSDKVQLEEQILNPKTAYALAPFRPELLDQCVKVKNKFLNITHFVHVGIGGSSLGPEMLLRALKNPGVNFLFMNNIDPDDIQDQLDIIPFESSVFYFVSKSGGTAETLAAFSLIINYFEMRGKSKADIFKRFVFATDPVKSELLEIGKLENIPCLEIPSAVGGRFSVLTPVGYFPALFAGIDVRALLQGAQSTHKLINDEKSDLYKMAHFLFTLKQKENRSLTVLMPYSSKLREFSFWFTQLWAESLGKELDNNGNMVRDGFTPIPAYGATDQHSQMQLFMEGPNDKVMILIEVEHFTRDFSLKNQFATTSLQKLNKHRLSELLSAELKGTLKALETKERPFVHIKIPSLDAESLGALILFFELLTGLMGIKMNVDPFNQPGVELGKTYAFQWLNQLK